MPCMDATILIRKVDLLSNAGSDSIKLSILRTVGSKRPMLTVNDWSEDHRPVSVCNKPIRKSFL